MVYFNFLTYPPPSFLEFIKQCIKSKVKKKQMNLYSALLLYSVNNHGTDNTVGYMATFGVCTHLAAYVACCNRQQHWQIQIYTMWVLHFLVIMIDGDVD